MHISHRETHRNDRIGWLRAAILGANDGIVSTASLIVGVAAANAETHAVLLSGLAGLVAGAMSMAAGEYVSVSSQADTEEADLDRERRELEANPEFEKQELASIYVGRGLDETLARQVAEQLMSKDALAAHARDELGIIEATQAKPIQAALASAASFAVGAIPPLGSVLIVSPNYVVATVIIITTVLLAVLGAAGAMIGGANVVRASWRVTFWGLIAMGSTAVVGYLFGVSTA